MVTYVNENRDAKRLLAELKIKVRNAWLVLERLPDLDARFRRGLSGGGWCLTVVRGWQAIESSDDTFATDKIRTRPPTPSPHEITEAEGIMSWMVWLRQKEGRAAVNRIIAWARGAPWCNMSAREGCSDRTVKNRLDRSMAAVMLEFRDEKLDIPVVDEPALSGDWRFKLPLGKRQHECGGSGGEVMPGKCFIGGQGFRFHGKAYDSAQLR
jgi:hypothetical protein